MKNLSTGCLLALFSLLAGGCAGSREPPRPLGISVDRSVIPKALPATEDQAAYRAMLTEARQWQRQAASVDGEWRDVDALLQQAQQAAEAGDFARAIELAEFARFQAEMGYRQMRAQEQVENPRFLYY